MIQLLMLLLLFCDTILSEQTIKIDNGQQMRRYDSPDDCKYLYGQNLNEISLTCNLRTVNSEFDATNFSVIPSENTISLTIICNENINVKSNLESKSFIHLIKLKELNFEYCKFSKLNNDILYGLNDLRNLTIQTHNINHPALSLEIESESFSQTKNLERLDLSRNNIWSLPENLFCNLNDLIWLNISENRLQDINDLGFREKFQIKSTTTNEDNNNKNSTKISTCSVDLELLDVSYNYFVLLPENGFGTLKRLRYLKINNNEISMVADKALGGLKNLEIVDMNSNKIVALPSELFQDPAHTIQEIYLRNNSISVLSPGLFSNLEQLLALDLSTNQLTSSWINRATFSGLIRLVLLNLSDNKITKLEPEIFSDLYTLQILNLRKNQLEIIPADTFSPMNNLHTLLLSYNRLKYLDAYSLNGLYVLSLLSLDNNQLNGVHPEAFRNCSSLQDLNLNGNELLTVPLALKDMRLLRSVDLGENKLTFIEEISFRGMTNLYGLRLIGNEIKNLTKNTFKNLPSLQILNLARNNINFIEKGTFDIVPSMQAIRLDGNNITDINNLFNNIQTLIWLNISNNHLTEFDLSFIPKSLQWLDIHKNEIQELSNRYGLDNQFKLETFDASFNKLTKITSSSIPNSIELLFLNDNLITTIENFTFTHKVNLTRVDLYANQITTLDIKALRLDPVSNDKPLPEFYIGGNPFICDCNIDWLLKENLLESRQVPHIMDIETIYCKLLYNRDREYVQLIDAQPDDFLCTYRTHCFALCQCCDFDACDCEMTCPSNCTCFHDQSWSTNVVECTNSGYKEIPLKIPMDTTEVYIDGNNLYELSGHSFIGRKNLRVLYANNSNIHIIYNTTFTGLKRLQLLHLENNNIRQFIGNELTSLENLQQLYLNNNKIKYINNQTFIELKKLEVLRLDGNLLTNYDVWILSVNHYLVEIALSDNTWTCECNYLDKMRQYLLQNGDKIIDANKIACVYNNLTSVLKEKNGTKCTLKDGISTIVHSKEIEDLLPLLLIATCAFVGFFGLLFGIFCYRRELNLWAHSHCPINMCYKTADFVDDYDKDRLYDAYVSYSLQDDHFVNQILSATLENDVGYRLCLHYRDFNINTYIADTIIEAVESSKRTILVLSKNFLYNEWSRFEYKSAIHEIIKRRKKIIFILYGDIPQRDIDHNMRLFLRSNTCIEWDDKKFWQKLRIVLPHIKANKSTGYLKTINHQVNNQHQQQQQHRSPVNIYATTNNFNTTTSSSSMRRNHHQDIVPRIDYNTNYSTLNNKLCNNRNCDNFEQQQNINGQQQYGGTLNRTTKLHSQITHPSNHEYAVPSNCLTSSSAAASIPPSLSTLKQQGYDPYNFNHGSHSDCSHTSSSNEINCGIINDHRDNDCTLNINIDDDDDCFSYNCTNNCNCSHSNCACDHDDDDVDDNHHNNCCSNNIDKSVNNKTGTTSSSSNNCCNKSGSGGDSGGGGGGSNCIERRLPQAIWA